MTPPPTATTRPSASWAPTTRRCPTTTTPTSEPPSTAVRYVGRAGLGLSLQKGTVLEVSVPSPGCPALFVSEQIPSKFPVPRSCLEDCPQHGRHRACSSLCWEYIIPLKVRGSSSTSRNQINFLCFWLCIKKRTYLKPLSAFKCPPLRLLLLYLLTWGKASDDAQLHMNFAGVDNLSAFRKSWRQNIKGLVLAQSFGHHFQTSVPQSFLSARDLPTGCKKGGKMCQGS